MPVNCVFPVIKLISATNKIPIVTAPGIFLCDKPTITIKPNAAIAGENAVISPSPTNVASLLTMTPAVCKEIKAKNAPIPATTPCLILSGIELIINSRILKRLNNINIQPDKNTAPSAVCHA